MIHFITVGQQIYIFLIHVIRRDYNQFLEDLEEDPQLRQHINIFRDSSKQIPVDTNDMDDPSVPKITLEEMLDDLNIEDVEMGADDDADENM